ncbi:MAG: hypothetical protein ABMA13_01175 [Chthoniobacteraceae bacterium]
MSISTSNCPPGLRAAEAPLYWLNGRYVTPTTSSNGEEELAPMTTARMVTWISRFITFLAPRRGEMVGLTKNCAEIILASDALRASVPIIDNVEALILPGVEIDETMTAQEGLGWLRKAVLGEFPFWPEDKERSVAVVVAAMLTGFAQLLIADKAQRPCFVVMANAERSGKTLLVRIMLCPVFGRAKVTPPPSGVDDAELPKKIASLAFAGASYVFLDNCKGKIGGGPLEAFITSTVINDRLLGKSEMKEAANDLLYMFTGNNAELTPDMRGRSLVVELFVEEAQPELREVRNWLDENRVLAMRARILSVLWAIVREWAAGERHKSGCSHGTFQDWADVIGSMCECVGLVSPVKPPRLRKPVDADLAAFDSLLPLALEDRGDRRLMASGELMQFARELGALSFLQEEKPEDDKEARSERAAWGKRIERFIDQRFPSGCKIEWDDHTSRTNRRLIISRVADVSVPTVPEATE